MRAGWSEELARHVRANPRDARLIAEAITVQAEDIRQRADQWADRDAGSGVTVNTDGSVVLTGTLNTILDQTAFNQDQTDVDRAAPHFVAALEWDESVNSDFELERVTVHVNPDVSGIGPVDVAQWKMQIHALAEYNLNLPPEIATVPVSGPLTVDNPGASAGDLLFDFSGLGVLPAKVPPVFTGRGNIDPQDERRRTAYVFLWAIDENGDAAENAGWSLDNTQGSAAGVGVTLTRSQLVQLDDGRFLETAGGGVHRLKISNRDFTAATLTFSTNPIDLGAAPTGDRKSVV